VGGPALGRIEARGRVLDLADGAGVFAQGDAADAVYAILGGPGQVRIGAVERDSRGLMVELLGPGEIFGEIGVMDGSVRTADATAGLVRLLRVGAPVFLEALATEPALGRNLCRLLAARLRHTFALLQDATFGSLEVRLARQILYLARRGGRCTEQGLRLAGRCRQGDLADMRGTTTRSIIPILNVWRQSGVVAYELARAQLTLTGEAALQALVEKGATG